MIKKIIIYILSKIGYEIKSIKEKKKLGRYDFEDEAKEAIEKVQSYTMVSREPLITLYQQVRHCELKDIEGCYVECGTWKGGSGGIMAIASKQYQVKPRHIHLFDSFEDICEPDPFIDGQKAINESKKFANLKAEEISGRLKPMKGFYDDFGGHGTEEDVKRLLIDELSYPSKFLQIHKGWFQETLPSIESKIGKIAILRIDGDWYKSTRTCLEHLYKHVSIGGFIIIDDYACYEGCTKAVDEFREINKIDEFMIHVNSECRYWIKTK